MLRTYICLQPCSYRRSFIIIKLAYNRIELYMLRTYICLQPCNYRRSFIIIKLTYNRIEFYMLRTYICLLVKGTYVRTYTFAQHTMNITVYDGYRVNILKLTVLQVFCIRILHQFGDIRQFYIRSLSKPRLTRSYSEKRPPSPTKIS